MEQPGVVAADFGLSFSFHFLSIFVHISGSVRPITLIWAALERSSPPTEVEHSIAGGGVVEWLRALDLKSGGPWFKSSTLPLSGFVLGSPEFNSSTALCK